MKQKLATILLLFAFVLPVFAQTDDLKAENAKLKSALSQALDQLDYYTNLAKAADETIEAQKKTIADAKVLIKVDESERAVMDKIIADAKIVITNLQAETVNYKAQIEIYKKKIALLESQLAREKRRSKFWKTLFIFGIPVIAIGTVILTNKNE